MSDHLQDVLRSDACRVQIHNFQVQLEFRSTPVPNRVGFESPQRSKTVLTLVVSVSFTGRGNWNPIPPLSHVWFKFSKGELEYNSITGGKVNFIHNMMELKSFGGGNVKFDHTTLINLLVLGMATFQLSASSVTVSAKNLASFEELKPYAVEFSSLRSLKPWSLNHKSFKGLIVKAATVVAPKYTSIKPLGDRVLVKIKEAEEKTEGGILLPTMAQSKPQGGEVVDVGEGKTVGKTKLESSVKTGGKVAEAEEKTAGGLLLTEASKEKPSIGTVRNSYNLVGNGNIKPLSVAPGNAVLYSKYAGNDFKASDGTNYITLRASDVMASRSRPMRCILWGTFDCKKIPVFGNYGGNFGEKNKGSIHMEVEVS
ncbi:20 kDa chaperonin [Hibiscus syriacus]|uniref:20 kDa chaperonin, chloroplastic n=1 Tax=Hibiscus syriacus TaxID=106335 RepID=A0A6A2X3A3_HIBSY|nr:20 kDa chaperonin [Hibiscus syriacus]